MNGAVARAPLNQATVGVLLASSAAIAFGTLAIFAKVAYEQGATPIPLLAVRFTIASALLVAWHLVTRRSLALPARAVVRLLLLGAFGYAVEASLFFAALDRAPASVVGLVFYSYPMWTTVLAFIMGLEPVRARMLVALGLGMAGVALIFSLARTEPEGPLLALVAAVAVSVYFVAVQVAVRGVKPSAAATWTAIGAGLALVVVTVAKGDGLPVAAVPPAAGLGLATALAFVGLYGAVVRIGSARAGVAMMLEPLTTLVLAALLLGEVITPRVALGAALIVAALPVLASSQPAP